MACWRSRHEEWRLTIKRRPRAKPPRTHAAGCLVSRRRSCLGSQRRLLPVSRSNAIPCRVGHIHMHSDNQQVVEAPCQPNTSIILVLVSGCNGCMHTVKYTVLSALVSCRRHADPSLVERPSSLLEFEWPHKHQNILLIRSEATGAGKA